jgi:hypothetical protein
MGLIFGYAILNKADKRVEAYNLTKPATGSRTACTIYPIMSSARLRLSRMRLNATESREISSLPGLT